MSSKHIIVIGGGVVGACATYYLSRNIGIRVTVIEKTGVACNASGKAGGFLAYNWSDDTAIGDLSRKSFKLHGELATELDGENKYGYRKVDTYSVLYQGGKSKPKTKQDMDVMAWIDASGIRHMEKLGNMTDTAQVHPRLFTETLFETAKQTGNVTLRTGFGVSHVIIDDDQIHGVQLDNGEIINGDSVVVCMGAWSGQLPTLHLPIDGQRAHSIVFKPQNPVPAQMLFTTILDGTRTHHPEVYPRPDGTVYMCGATDNTKLPSSADQIQVDSQAIRELERLRDTLAPELYGGDKLIAQQACYLPVSEDGTPFVGPHPKYKQLIIAAGHSCWGILQAPATGLMISELIVNDRISCVDREAVEALDPTNRC
ncbi:FAD dependent oxidoreductase [Phascolomyces articulosus]|uniref:FAD dependent oxidoreductase n=1 Tax=Phascolomyces articulosus TaxID=60185 RepID=A0AAD5PEY1_9FUNG|nr:FAD dependent oxidoreductase [Phascolomyces articulosus]